MITLNNFKHTDKKKKYKYEFFADVVENLSKILGKYPKHQLETHTALLEKIVFQYENNLERYSKKYLGNYFKNSLFSTDDIFLNSENGKEIKTLLSQKDTNQFRNNLKNQIEGLKKKILKRYVSEIYHLIVDDTISPRQARRKIEYYANLVVSEYLFEGFSRKDIYNMPHMVIYGQRDKNSVNRAIVKQTTKVETNLKDQIFQIVELCYGEKLYLQYVFKINNLIIEDNFKYKLNGITFGNPKYKNTRKIIPRNIRDEFLDFDGILAYQNLRVNSADEGFAIFVTNLTQSLNYLNTIYQGFSNINFDKCHIFNLELKSGIMNWNNINTFITEGRVKWKDEIYNLDKIFSKNRNSKRILYFKQLEQTYFRGKSTKYKKEKILLFWQYLEIIFDYQKRLSNSNQKKDKSDFIIQRLSRILLDVEFDNYYIAITNEFINIGINNSPKIGLERMNFQYEYLVDRHYLDFEKFKNLKAAKDHMFIGYEIKKITKYSNNMSRELKEAHKFYKSSLIEAYEQRNFLVHNGKVMKKAVIKSSLILEKMIDTLRRIIVDSLKDEKYARISIHSILERKYNEVIL